MVIADKDIADMTKKEVVDLYSDASLTFLLIQILDELQKIRKLTYRA